jgi:hypothetical protein
VEVGAVEVVVAEVVTVEAVDVNVCVVVLPMLVDVKDVFDVTDVEISVVAVVVVADGAGQTVPVILDLIQVMAVETRAYTPVHRQCH